MPVLAGHRIVGRVEDRRPEVVELATALSIAARAEPALVRQVRLDLLPEVPVSAEADLWFSPLVAFADDDGLVLRNDVGVVLRRRLAGNTRLLWRARRIIVDMHHRLSATLVAEENILWWACRNEPDDDRRIRDLLRQVAATVRSDPERRDNLLRWMAHAFRRMPPAALQTDWAGCLAASAAARLGLALPRSLVLDEVRRGAQLVPTEAPTTPVGLTLTRTGVLVTEPPGADSVAVSVTAGRPLVVEVAPARLPARPTTFELKRNTSVATPLTQLAVTSLDRLTSDSWSDSDATPRWGIGGALALWAYAEPSGVLALVDTAGQLSLVDTRGNTVTACPLPDRATALASSGDGFVVGTAGGEVRRVDADGPVELLTSTKAAISLLAVSDDGSDIAVALSTGRIVILSSVPNGDDVVTWRSASEGWPSDRQLIYMTQAPGGLICVTGDGVVALRDTATGEPIVVVPQGLDLRNPSVVAVRDGRGLRLALATEAEVLFSDPPATTPDNLWNLRRRLSAPGVTSLAFAPGDGPLLLTTETGDVGWWDGRGDDIVWHESVGFVTHLVPMGDSVAVARLGGDAQVTFASQAFTVTAPTAKAQEVPALDLGLPDDRFFEQILNGDCVPVLGGGVPDELLALLAEQAITVYISLDFEDQVERALRAAGKEPVVMICPWFPTARSSLSLLPKGYRPAADVPLVLHIYGHVGDPASLVRSEDDHIQLFLSMVRDQAIGDQQVVPLQVLAELAARPAVFVGPDLRDRTFRMLLHGLGEVGGLRRRHLCVQPYPDVPGDPRRAARYLSTWFDQLNGSIFWGSTTDFADELDRRRGARHG